LLDECHRRYGDAFTLDIGGRGRFVMLSDPETVREVFRANPDVLHAGEANAVFRATVGRQSVLVLDDLFAATHEDGSPLDEQEVRDALVTILIAGHDTTALALAWALADIVPRPDVVDRLADELRGVTGGGPPEADHLPALEYLDAAIRESLRRRPVAPFVVRKTVRPFAAGGREYPTGVVLCPCSYLVHRREDLYPEPDRFRPERFLERKFGPHEWFPFGGANRVCLGMPFALYEMKVLLATFFSQVRLARPAGARSRARRYGIVLGPDDGAQLIVRGSTA
jgi:cytochrome P450